MVSGRQGGEGLAEGLPITHRPASEDRNPGWDMTKKGGGAGIYCWSQNKKMKLASFTNKRAHKHKVMRVS